MGYASFNSGTVNNHSISFSVSLIGAFFLCGYALFEDK
jgi:hypothetical protein